MANNEMISKRLAISKSNAQMVIVVAVAAFVSIFCLVAAHAVWGENTYLSRVISKQRSASNQLNHNISAFNQLSTAYQSFISTPTNVIGGQTSGTGTNQGSNAQIILDALPPTYDFPALATSLNQLLTSKGFPNASISGTDDQITQQSNVISPTPTAVPIPFSFTISNASYASVAQVITATEESIRPIQIDTLSLTGGASNMTLSVTANTYYQPGKSVNITKQVVK